MNGYAKNTFSNLLCYTKGQIVFLLFILFPIFSSAQISINGSVKDAITLSSLPFVKVSFTEAKSITRTDINGDFKIDTPFKKDTLKFECLGYTTFLLPCDINSMSEVTVFLAEANTNLNAVVVNAGENPAFKILQKVQENKSFNNPEKLDAYECEVYNKMQFDINNMSKRFEDRKALQKFDFIFDYLDTIDGASHLPVLLSESISNYYFKKDPKQKKEIIKGSRITGIENLQLEQFTGDMYQNVNVYENYIELFNKAFLSPIANEGKLFYKYYLKANDTLEGVTFYHIEFVPKREGDLVFAGEMWIDQETFALKRVTASIPDNVNLNYVSGFKVDQFYTKVDSNSYMLTREVITANFDVFNELKKNRLMGVTIHKDVTRKNYILNAPKSFEFYVQDIVTLDSATARSESYWEEQRHSELSQSEAGVIKMVDSLKNNRTFRFYENLSYFGYTGFWKTGPIEIGNWYSVYNTNVVEGTRVMLSLRTSNKFSKKFEISAFTAYGTLDKEWKYGGSLRWKLRDRPREMLRFAYRKRIDQLGLIATIGNVGNSFSTLLSAAPLDKLTMVNQASVGFEKDWSFDMRTFNTIEWKRYIPLGSSDYSRIDIESGDTNQIASLTSFQVRNQIMFTKEEKFLKGQFDRISLGSKYPIISLSHTWGIKDVLFSEYDFHRVDFIWNHRPRLGMLGRLNYTIHAGKIFGTVPYPFLEIHQGNETYNLQLNNFNLMNYYEFISDQWVRILFEHHLQGFVMDRIPLIRKLKLRLVYSAKMVIGSYSNKHNKKLLLPFYSRELSSPYYEAGIGIENILKFIRVDAIWRLAYRDNLDLLGNQVSNFGIKFTFTSDF